jgi:ATP-binding cassette subfamily B protein
MSAMVLAALPFIVLPMVALGRWVRGRQRFAQDRLADSSAFATEAIGAMRILQAFGQEKRARGFFRRESKKPLARLKNQSKLAPC